MSDVAKWREAYPGIELSDEAINASGPYPSLYASDYLVFLERKATDPQTVAIVRAMHRELVHAYGGWSKAARDGDPVKLLDALQNSAGSGDGIDYSQIHKFISDWRRANGYETKQAGGQPWLANLPTPEELGVAVSPSI